MPTHGRLDLRSGGTAAGFARESAQPRASATRPRRTFLLHSDPCSSNESHVRVLQSEAHDDRESCRRALREASASFSKGHAAALAEIERLNQVRNDS